jgi:hypothetical protein
MSTTKIDRFSDYPDFRAGYAEAEANYTALRATHPDDSSHVLSRLWRDANLGCIIDATKEPPRWHGMGRLQHLYDLCSEEVDPEYRSYLAQVLFRYGVDLCERGDDYKEAGLSSFRRLQNEFNDLSERLWVAMSIIQAAHHIVGMVDEAVNLSPAEARSVLEAAIDTFETWHDPEDANGCGLIRHQVAGCILDLVDLIDSHFEAEPETTLALHKRLITAYRDETSEDTPFLVSTALLETGVLLGRTEPPDATGAMAAYTEVIQRLALGWARADQAACALYRIGNLKLRLTPPDSSGAIASYKKVIESFAESDDEETGQWVALSRYNCAQTLIKNDTDKTEIFLSLHRANIEEFSGSTNPLLQDIVNTARYIVGDTDEKPESSFI